MVNCLAKMPEQVARIALLLHVADGDWHQEITDHEVERAIKIAECFTAHAQRAEIILADDALASKA